MHTAVAVITMITMVLLPLQCVELPLNTSILDWWNAATLPLLLAWLLRGDRPVHLPLFTCNVLIWVSALVASCVSLFPTMGLVATIKEIYLYAWFVTLVGVFAYLEPRWQQRILAVWVTVACGHGLLILAQFESPALLDAMNARLRGIGHLDPHRPSGLINNCNAAAVYQLMAFPAVMMWRTPVWLRVGALAVLSLSLVGTGSMGALAAAIAGAAFGLALIPMLYRDWALTMRCIVAALVGGAVLLGVGAVWLSNDPELAAQLEAMLFGRTDRSAGSRFELWGAGLALWAEGGHVLGIGPETYWQIAHKELHNDAIAFTVERGILGVIAVVALPSVVLVRAFHAVRLAPGERARLVFPALVVAAVVESLTHEILHWRQLWLALALMEGVIARHAVVQRSAGPQRWQLSPSPA